MPAQDYRTSIRLLQAVRSALEARAAREGRSVAGMAEWLVMVGLLQSGDLPEIPEVPETRGRKKAKE